MKRRVGLLHSMSPEVCRVSDADLKVEPRRRRPASESRQGTNPRAMVRGGRRVLSYGDLADADGVCEGTRCGWIRAMARLVGNSCSG
jgi:hypothetical protein